MRNVNEMKNVDVQNYISRKCSIEDIKKIIGYAEFMLEQKRNRLFSKFKVGDKVFFIENNENKKKIKGTIKKITKKMISIITEEGDEYKMYPEYFTNTVNHELERIYEYMH